MIRKQVSIMAIGIFIVLVACNPIANEKPGTAESPNPPTTMTPDNEMEEPETNKVNDGQSHVEILAQVKSAIQTDVELKLPENVLTSNGFLTATTASSQNNYEVNFYVTNVPVPVNAPTLHDAHPYMIVTGMEFDSVDAAKAKINYQPIQEGAEKKDLEYGITGYMDAGAGSVFLTWHEGRWSFSIHKLASENSSNDMIELAKQIVGKLESQLLPAPQEMGAGTFDMNSKGAAANSLMWQEQETVYEIYTSDPLLLIDTVTGYMGN